MVDAVLKRLKQKLAVLEAQRSQLDEEITAFRVVIASLEASETEDTETSSAQAASKRSAPPKELTNRIWRILADEGHPMHYQAIYARLKEQGAEVPGKDPAKNVGAHMSADPRFENVSRGLWGLKSWRQPGEYDRAIAVERRASDPGAARPGGATDPASARPPIPLVRPLTAQHGP